MKKNLFIAALAFVAMGTNAQVVNTLDGYQAGDQFTEAGIVYEVLEVSDQSAATVKVVAAAGKSVTVQSQFIKDATYTVVDFSAGIANEDLEEVATPATEPIDVPEAFFSAATYQSAILTIPDGSFKKYCENAVWFKFLAKQSESGTILGELTGDNIVDLDDVAAMFALFEEYIMEGDDEYKEEYDMNGDGVLDLDDVSFVFSIFEEYPWVG